MKAAYVIKQDKTLQVEIVDKPEKYLEKNKFLENVQLLNVDHVNNQYAAEEFLVVTFLSAQITFMYYFSRQMISFCRKLESHFGSISAVCDFPSTPQLNTKWQNL